MIKADFGVFIGRFQPLHIGHEHVIRQALSQLNDYRPRPVGSGR